MTPFEVADALRACLDGAYEGDAEKPAEICHRPGAEAPFSAGLSQDECCSGLGWVRISSIDPEVDPLNSQGGTNDDNPCHQTGRRVTLELGVARCNPYGTAERGPTCDEWTALALRMDQDASAMRRAVCCFSASEVDDYGPVHRVRLDGWEPIDSSGGCAGGIMTVVVWMDCQEC
jgi:hypothetical protein